MGWEVDVKWGWGGWWMDGGFCLDSGWVEISSKKMGTEGVESHILWDMGGLGEQCIYPPIHHISIRGSRAVHKSIDRV